MDFLVQVEDSKAPFFLELMKNLHVIKTKRLTPENAAIMEGIKNAVEEVKLARHGKIKLKSARQLLREL
jgi:hypothetical protein